MSALVWRFFNIPRYWGLPYLHILLQKALPLRIEERLFFIIIIIINFRMIDKLLIALYTISYSLSSLRRLETNPKPVIATKAPRRRDEVDD